ncbi:MAG: hypothetical protein IKC47_01755 [Clostridia bacterium]|nr:hypothetical protein [Clostridia bacterium]
MKNYLKQLKTELDSRAPEMSSKVKQTSIVTNQQRKPMLASIFGTWQRVAAFCVALVLVIGVGVVGVGHVKDANYQANASYVALSINPSFTIMLDSNDKVVKVVATNYDGEVVLSDELSAQLQGTPADEAVTTLVDNTYSMGYQGDGTVDVAVASAQKESKVAKLMQKVQQSASQVAQQYGIDAKVQVAKQSVEQLQQLAKGYFNQAESTLQGLLNQLSQAPSYMQQLEAQANAQFDKAVQDYGLQSKVDALKGFVATLQQRNDLLSSTYDTIEALCTEIGTYALFEGIFDDPIELLSSPKRAEIESVHLVTLLNSLEQALSPLAQASIKVESFPDLILAKQSYQQADSMIGKLKQIQDELSKQGQILDELLQGYVVELCNWVAALIEDAQQAFDQIDSFVSTANPQDFIGSVKDKVNQDRIERAPQGGQHGKPQGK